MLFRSSISIRIPVVNMDRIFWADGMRHAESFFEYVSRDEQPVFCFVTVLLAVCRITEGCYGLLRVNG